MRTLLLAVMFVGALPLIGCSGDDAESPAVAALATTLPPEATNAIAEARQGAKELLASPLVDAEVLCQAVRDLSDEAAYEALLVFLRDTFPGIEERGNAVGVDDEALVERATGAVLKEECNRMY